jgi:hypothetical protein
MPTSKFHVLLLRSLTHWRFEVQVIKGRPIVVRDQEDSRGYCLRRRTRMGMMELYRVLVCLVPPMPGVGYVAFAAVGTEVSATLTKGLASVSCSFCAGGNRLNTRTLPSVQRVRSNSDCPRYFKVTYSEKVGDANDAKVAWRYSKDIVIEVLSESEHISPSFSMKELFTLMHHCVVDTKTPPTRLCLRLHGVHSSHIGPRHGCGRHSHMPGIFRQCGCTC